MTGYVWLKFFHLFGLALFLFGHGISGGASFALRSTAPASARQLLQLSQRSAIVANPGLLIVIITGVWMGFAGSWWGRGWIWAAVAVLVLLIGFMLFIARPYYLARDASGQPDDVLVQRLSRTRPLLAAVIGGVGLLILIALMVIKPF